MARNEVLTARPPEGDYVLSQIGLTWSIIRSKGDGTGKSVSDTDATKYAALEKVVALASADDTDIWEAVETDVFRLIRRFRPPTDTPPAP